MEGPQPKFWSPKLLVLVKLHKLPVTSRWFTIGVNSPVYLISQELSFLVKEIIELMYTYNLQNSEQLMGETDDISVDYHTRMCSSDMSKLCTNISVTETMNIIDNLMKENCNNTFVANQEVPYSLKVVLNWNIFRFKKHYHRQYRGPAMCTTTSTLIAEICLQIIKFIEYLSF